MLRVAVENVPDDKWHERGKDWYFSLTVYHIVETMEFYLGENPDTMTWGAKAGFNWEEADDKEKDILPKITKKLVMMYLDEVETLAKNTITTLSIETLSSKDGFHWFKSVLEKLLYLLRHNMHHIGELSKTLRDWECKRAKWE
jgi:uncharacterized damage-inducible protein DinB